MIRLHFRLSLYFGQGDRYLEDFPSEVICRHSVLLTQFLAKFWRKIHYPNFFKFRCLYFLITVISEIYT